MKADVLWLTLLIEQLPRWVHVHYVGGYVCPLKKPAEVNERLDIVECFVNHETERLELEQILHTIGDLERLASKIAVGRISPREMVQLKIALQAIKPLKEQCLSTGNEVLTQWMKQLDDCETLSQRIEREIKEDAPSMLNKGNVNRFWSQRRN